MFILLYIYERSIYSLKSFFERQGAVFKHCLKWCAFKYYFDGSPLVVFIFDGIPQPEKKRYGSQC